MTSLRLHNCPQCRFICFFFKQKDFDVVYVPSSTELTREFTSRLEDTKALVNGDVVFKCQTTVEDETVDWYLDGKKLESDNKYEMTSVGTEHTLTIHDLQPVDGGTVTVCYGDDESSAKLEVEGAHVFLYHLPDIFGLKYTFSHAFVLP